MVCFLLADGANIVCFCNLCKYRFTNSAFCLHVTLTLNPGSRGRDLLSAWRALTSVVSVAFPFSSVVYVQYTPSSKRNLSSKILHKSLPTYFLTLT